MLESVQTGNKQLDYLAISHRFNTKTVLFISLCNIINHTSILHYCLARSCQKAIADAAATLSESTPCDIGMRTT